MKSDGSHSFGITYRSGVSGRVMTVGGKKHNLRDPQADGRERAVTHHGIRTALQDGSRVLTQKIPIGAMSELAKTVRGNQPLHESAVPYTALGMGLSAALSEHPK
jgi:hypothetical protein